MADMKIRCLAWVTMAAAVAAGPTEAALDGERLIGLRARNIGPAGMSGRVAAIEALASDPDTVYVGAATGGLWRSKNRGVTWEPLFDEQPVHAIGSVAVFPANPDIVWVGTGEGNVRNSASVGNGVYRSMDAGKTWHHLGLAGSERIHKIALHPTSPDVAYVCATGPEWGETKERGVFRTEDGGKSWTRLLGADERTGCGDLVMHPTNPRILIASLWQFRRWPYFFKSGGPGSGLFLTHDGGATWRKVQEEDGLPKGELGRIGLAIAPSAPQVVYALVEAEKSAMLRSDDGGRTWKPRNEKANVAPRPFYFNELRVDPKNADRVYSLDYEVRVSDDGGKTFATLPGATWAQIHGDHHALWIDPSDPAHMYAGNDGGVAVSNDRGKTFRFVGNLPLAQFYHVSFDHEEPFNVYGGLQDNGSWRGPSTVWQQGGIRNHHWQEVGGGDGFETLPDPADSMQGYALWQGGNLMRWNLRTGEQKMVKPAPPAAGEDGTPAGKLRFNWNAALAVDPFDQGTIYLGSQHVHRSTDRGETWSIISPDLTSNNPEFQKQDTSGGLTVDVTAAENHTTLVAISPSPVQRGVLWTGSDDGRIHVTRDGGQTWTSVEKNVPGVPAGTWVPHVRPSKFDAASAFAVFDNHRRNDIAPYVARTDDYGRTWRSLVTPALRGYALSIEQDPVHRDLLFLGTEFGLYLSNDGGRSWSPLHRTLPTASVMDLAIHPRDHDLVVATHGRALWVLDDVRPLRALTDAALLEPLRLYDVSPARQHWRRSQDGGFGFGASEFRGENRPYGAILTWSLNQPGLPLHDPEKERARKEKEREDKRTAVEGRPTAAVAPGRERTESGPVSKEKEGDAPAGKKEDEKKPDDVPKVEIRVADAAGAIIRRFKAPARLGVSRGAWDLRRDAFRLPPRAEDAPPPEEEEAGPEVPPGTYRVTVAYGGHESTQTVEVRPDPRSRNTADDWQRRWDTIRRVGQLSDTAVDAVWRIRRTRDDVGIVQQKVRQSLEARGEKDPKVAEAHPLVKAGETLKEGLAALEKRLWVSPDTKGIQPENDVLSQIANPAWYVGSSWDPPAATHLAHIDRGERALSAFMPDFDRFFATDVENYRRQVDAAGVRLLGGTELAK